VAGVALTVVVAALVGMSAADAARQALTAVSAAAGAGAVGGIVLSVLRQRSVAVQATAVALTAVGAVGAGVLAAAAAMYVAPDDLEAVAVVVMAGGTIGVVTALALGQRVLSASRSLGDVARRIGDGASPQVLPELPVPATGELADLGRELAAMAERLERSRASERALDESRRELVAWVSHDLRTPLAGIRAITEALEDKVVEDPQTVARYYRTLRQEADRLAALVDDLFELSRIQAGALRLQMEQGSLGDLLSDALAAADPVAAAKGVRLQGRLHEETPDLVLSAPEVSRILRNLLENAIRHTPSDGTVCVEAGVEQGSAFVSVADACGGIEVAEIDRVFDLAYRGETARTPGTDGAGLGLAIAKGLVEAHQGEIVVANEGPGCRFTVRLPLPHDPTAVAP
jgi:signal transduction histidine kinase